MNVGFKYKTYVIISVALTTCATSLTLWHRLLFVLTFMGHTRTNIQHIVPYDRYRKSLKNKRERHNNWDYLIVNLSPTMITTPFYQLRASRQMPPWHVNVSDGSVYWWCDCCVKRTIQMKDVGRKTCSNYIIDLNLIDIIYSIGNMW